jgi:8-amino-7-oxononanoate synthase
MPQPLDPLLDLALTRRAESGQFRKRRLVRPIDSVHLEIDSGRYTNFCSNNYLGLTHHPRVIAALQRGADEFGAGSGAAGLISGYTPAHAAAESAIASWKNVPAAVLLPSGYQANLAAIGTIAAAVQSNPAGGRFLIDKLAHASLLDAVRGSEIPFRIFPHNGLAKLRRLLAEAQPGETQIVVTESIFSMDGDAAELARLAKLKQDHPFVLLLDEAHGSGIYGQNGAGLAAELGLQDAVDISVVTLSKSAGCAGGAICCDEKFRDGIINFARGYIYSTSPAPAIAAAISESISVMRGEPHRQLRVRSLAKYFRDKIAKYYQPPPGDSPIIPIIVGEESAAIQLSEKIFQMGLLVQAVRPPTVPRGTSRLRITLSCDHSDPEIEQLLGALIPK